MCYRPRFVSPPPVPSPAVSDFVSPSPRFMSPPMTSPLSVSCTEGDTSFLHQSAPSSFNLPQQEQVDDLPDDMLSVLSDCYIVNQAWFPHPTLEILLDFACLVPLLILVPLLTVLLLALVQTLDPKS